MNGKKISALLGLLEVYSVFVSTTQICYSRRQPKGRRLKNVAVPIGSMGTHAVGSQNLRVRLLLDSLVSPGLKELSH